jgi:GDPmannose 4,6-dehydratase
LGLEECVYLGNLDARRDWGHTRDYAEAQWLILQQPVADDFVVASGQQHSVRDFLEAAAGLLDFKLEWRGQGESETGVDGRTGKVIVRIDRRYFRPAEVDSRLGDASKAHAVLGWRPKTSFSKLVSEMVESDLEIARRDQLISKSGFKVARRNE